MNIIGVVTEKDLQTITQIDKDLEAMEHKLEKLLAERDEYKAAYKKSVDLALKKSVDYEAMRQREGKLHFMLHQACNEMESAFDDHGELDSVDIAVEYTVWAKFLKDNYGREDYGRVKRIMEWIDK